MFPTLQLPFKTFNMPRVRPTKRLDIIGNLDLRPEDAVGDYFTSKAQKQYFVKPPSSDSAGDSIDLLFIHNVREHEAMLALQSEMLAGAKSQTDENAARVRKMYKIQERLRKRFISVNSFIKDCMDKKRDAEMAIEDEKALHVELAENIKQFKTSIDELGSFRKALKATVEEFEPYEKVLDDVVKVSDIFVSPKDCMDRCDALMLAQVEIRELEDKKLREIEEMRQKMVKVTNEAALTVLGLKNDLARLERSYNQSRVVCLKWEKILSGAKDTISDSEVNKERTLDAISSLYSLFCRRKDEIPMIQRNDVESQLDFIKTEIEILNDLINEEYEGKDKLGKTQQNTEEDKTEC